MLKNLKNLSKSSLPENSKFKWIVISVLIFFLLIIILYLSTIQKKPFAVSANSSKSAPLILQKKLHDNLEAILKKTIGVGRYELSVIANINYDKSIKTSITYEPPQSSDGFDNLDDIEINEDFDLPGLFGSSDTQVADESEKNSFLPGFTNLFNKKNKDSKPEESSKDASALGDSAKEINIAPVSKEPSSIYGTSVNHKKEVIETDFTINGFLVGIVIDGNYFKENSPELKKIKELLTYASVIDAKRGDKLKISVIPFSAVPSETTFLINNIKSFIFHPIILILFIGSALGIVLFIVISKILQNKSAAKILAEQEAAEQERLAAEAAEAESKKKDQAFHELITAFNSSPNTAGTVLSDWIDHAESATSSGGAEGDDASDEKEDA